MTEKGVTEASFLVCMVTKPKRQARAAPAAAPTVQPVAQPAAQPATPAPAPATPAAAPDSAPAQSFVTPEALAQLGAMGASPPRRNTLYLTI